MRTDLVKDVNAVEFSLIASIGSITLVYKTRNPLPISKAIYELHYTLTKEEEISSMFDQSNVLIDEWTGRSIDSFLLSDDYLSHLPDGKVIPV